MKAVVAAFNQEKALVGAFSVIVLLHRLIDNTDLDTDGGEDAEVSLLHAHEDQLEIVEVGRGQRQGAGEVLDRVRF